MLDNFDTIKILLSTLGFTLFDSIKKESANAQHFFCKGKKAIAEGEYQDDGFVVFKGSKANTKLTPTASSTVINLRDNLLDTKILAQEGEIFVFQDDHLFSSPSAAASQVLARNANGWIEWKTKEGKTLDEIKRK